MRSLSLLCACACVLLAVCHAAPAPASHTLDTAETAAIEPQNDKEVIEIINLSNFGQSERDKRDINMLRQLFPGLAQEADSDDNALHGSESQNAEVRVKFDSDQDVAASQGGPSPVDETDGDDADRNKRFLPFGGSAGVGGHVEAGAGGSAGGSGNFLFDIIRLVAGSGSGSGASEAGDANANAPEVDVAKGADGYTEGVPGPITRLFVIANRGIANLIQDLILRLAQTSERIVNFKARLVTALI